MPEHKDIPESGLHEPKGVSTAASNQVYVSDGAGSGDWVQIGADQMEGLLTSSTEAGRLVVTDGSGGFDSVSNITAYGSWTLSGNGTVVSVPLATDSTLSDNSDYVIVNVAGAASPLSNMSAGSNYLEAEVDGVYYIAIWTNLFCSTTSTTVAVKAVVNGSDYGDRRAKAELPNGSDYANLAGTGFLTLSAGDQVGVAVAANKATNVTFEDMNISLNLVEVIE